MKRYLSVAEADQICRDVAIQFGIPASLLVSERKSPNIVRARWAAMRIMRDRGASYPMIGKRMQRHHTTVMHGLRRAG